MKSAEEIITEEWKDFDLKAESFKTLAIKAMKIYANQKLDEATENAEMTYHCGHTKNNLPTKYHQYGADNIQINKQSILSLKDEL